VKRLHISLVYDETARLAPDTEALGKAIQDLYHAAHHNAGVSFDVARNNWNEEHEDE
jgi:hypothetical protein